MIGMTRRRFLQALGLSVPAAVALKVLPVLDVVAAPAPVVAEDAAPTLPAGWRGFVIWINDEPYAVLDVSSDSRYEVINTTSLDAEYAQFDTARRNIEVAANLVGQHSLLADGPCSIRVEFGTHCVEFKSYIRRCEWRRCHCPDCCGRSDAVHSKTLVEFSVLQNANGAAVTWREL